MTWMIVLVLVGGVLLGLGTGWLAYLYRDRVAELILGKPQAPAPAVRERPRALDYLYVVAPFHRDAELFIQWTGADPKTFRIITREDQLLGLPQGIDAVFMQGNWHGRKDHTVLLRRLCMLQAKTRNVNLDECYGVDRGSE